MAGGEVGRFGVKDGAGGEVPTVGRFGVKDGAGGEVPTVGRFGVKDGAVCSDPGVFQLAEYKTTCFKYT